MLKSQKHYYWIGGGLWVALMVVGLVVLLMGAGRGPRMADDDEDMVFAEADLLTASEAELARRKILKTFVGQIDVTSGRITMTDPIKSPDRPPIDADIPLGGYTVTLYTPNPAGGVIGLAVVELGEGEATHWETASLEGTMLDELYILEVDQVLVIGDAEAVALLGQEALNADELFKEAATKPRHIMHNVKTEANTLQVALIDPDFQTFSAATYLGYDDNGNLLTIVRDFGYFDSERTFGGPTHTGE
ncbi:DUF4241 domain-containing protein [Vannielia sp.]|uniref:DUF4241 domain-containing protein n=1 Tax=Vannielia sp. TaxID=2813045 RepID=UPI0026331D49|nr:DUF4241 domain-containing protein [Vannielia sp.]MDF1872594.1 DUF4241 domain-containing protein [Vannielia sp.]